MARLWMLGLSLLTLACDPPTHVILHAPRCAAGSCALPAQPQGPLGPDNVPVPGVPACPAVEACPVGAQCGCSAQSEPGKAGVQVCSELCAECPGGFHKIMAIQGGCPVCRCVQCMRDDDCGAAQHCVAAEPCEERCTNMALDCCHGNRCESME